VQTALGQSSLQAIAQHLLCLVTRNMSSDGFVFTDPLAPGGFSAPGCIIAAPLFPAACQQRLWPPVPQATADAITWLGNALQEHWNGTYYASVLSMQPPRNGYDPNIGIVMAGAYGAVPYTDTKLLAQLRSFVASGQTARLPRPARSTPPARAAGIGPMLGRYPGGNSDGDTLDPVVGGHPWPVCTANFAELHYGLANTVRQAQSVPFDNFAADFFGLIGVAANTPWNEAVTSLQSAGCPGLSAPWGPLATPGPSR
jgi:hypothetical protein